MQPSRQNRLLHTVTQRKGASFTTHRIEGKKEAHSVIESAPKPCYYIDIYRVFYVTKGGFPDGFSAG